MKQSDHYQQAEITNEANKGKLNSFFVVVGSILNLKFRNLLCQIEWPEKFQRRPIFYDRIVPALNFSRRIFGGCQFFGGWGLLYRVH